MTFLLIKELLSYSRHFIVSVCLSVYLFAWLSFFFCLIGFNFVCLSLSLHVLWTVCPCFDLPRHPPRSSGVNSRYIFVWSDLPISAILAWWGWFEGLSNCSRCIFKPNRISYPSIVIFLMESFKGPFPSLSSSPI